MGKDSVSPKNWPSSIPYLIQPAYSPQLAASQRQSLKNRTPELTPDIPATTPKGPSILVKIQPITEPTHPAYTQSGLFAARPLAPDSFILPYYGIVHSSLPGANAEHETSDYDLWLNREASVAVDAAKAGNEARFVNDYRGVRERPNAEFRECWDPRRGEKCMAVFVLPAGKRATGKKGTSGIKKGEEICVSYGKGFWGKRKVEGLKDKEDTE